jgi:hypothetical protein
MLLRGWVTLGVLVVAFALLSCSLSCEQEHRMKPGLFDEWIAADTRHFDESSRLSLRRPPNCRA